MFLTPEQKELGRRTFLKVLAGTPALAALDPQAAGLLQGPLPGGPVRVGFIGIGGQGTALLNNADPAHVDVKALCDINPARLANADQVLAKKGLPPARHHADWREVADNKEIEAIITAVPLWAHAEVAAGCLAAGKHVLCEKMMAWDLAGCEKMTQAEKRSGRLLEIGYQRNYNPVYRSAYDGIIKRGVLGDIYYARLVWHRNANWRRTGQPPSPDYDPSRWGYPTYEHLLNWRLYKKYSRGLFAELASHQVNVSNWFLGAVPTAVLGCGGIFRFKDGREVDDHVYATFEYPNGRTATFSSIESNAFEEHYEAFYGTKGTLILLNEREAFLFEEGKASPTTLDVTQKTGAAVVDASETRPATPATRAAAPAPASGQRISPSRLEISGFCAAVRTGSPLACGSRNAVESARACIRGVEALEKKVRLTV